MKLDRVALGLLAVLILVLGLPHFRVLTHVNDAIDWWFPVLQVIVPAGFLAIAGFRANHPKPVRLLAVASVPYVAFVVWMIGATLWDRDHTTVGTVIASVIVLVSLALYLRFVDAHFSGPGEAPRWWRRERVTNVCSGVALALATVLVASSLWAHDLLHALTRQDEFITRAYGIGSTNAWTRARRVVAKVE